MNFFRLVYYAIELLTMQVLGVFYNITYTPSIGTGIDSLYTLGCRDRIAIPPSCYRAFVAGEASRTSTNFGPFCLCTCYNEKRILRAARPCHAVPCHRALSLAITYLANKRSITGMYAYLGVLWMFC